MTDTAKLPAIGEILGGKYRIERVLGEGGMGVVFEATHERLGQRVAIKMLLPALLEVAELVGRFEREARASAQLRHRNSARVVDVDVSPSGIPYIVMELLHGHDLEEELGRRGRLPIGEAVHYVLQACSAMSEAHRLGIVHRDLKPSNLFLNDEGDGTTCLKVLDFGISKIQTEDVSLTSTQAQMGTPLYMSPEQVRSAKNVDHRTDLWSLGIILYELIAGQPPFMGSAAGIGAAIVNDPPPPIVTARPDVPAELARVIERALTKSPADRFASARDLAAALMPFSSTPVPLEPRTSSGSIPRLSTSGENPAAIEHAATIAAVSPASVPSKNATGGSWAKESSSTKRSRPWAAYAGIALLAGVALGVGGFFALGRKTGDPTPTSSALPTGTSPSSSTASSITPEPSLTTSTAALTASTSAGGTARPPPTTIHPVTTKSAASQVGTAKPLPSKNPDRL